MNGTGKKQQSARPKARSGTAAQPRPMKRRRRTVVGVAAVTALAVAAGTGALLAGHSGNSGNSKNASGPLVVPANTTGDDRTVISYGKADAPHTLDIWLDPRCPYCAGVETGLGATMREQADQGSYRIDYHFATFLDGALGGKGSKRALSALGAAAQESPAKFMDYLGVLYANHPAKESDDTFGSTSTLLELADQVNGLRTPAFNKAVKELSYLPWAEKVSDAFYKSGETSTPVVKLDGHKLKVNSGVGIASVTPSEFTAEVRTALGK